MIVDMDIFNIDVRTFMNELYYSANYNVNGVCVNGIDWLGYTRDTFATVDVNGNWLHYGQSDGDSDYVYKNRDALRKRWQIPNEERNRFESVKSCFGGIVAYKNLDVLVESECKYTLTRDIFWTEYGN